MAAHFRRMERNQRLNNSMHGVEGSLAVSDHTHRVPVTHAFVTAMQGYGVEFNPDFNDGFPYGVGYIQLTADNVRRCSAVDAFLRPIMHNERLCLKTRAVVHRISFDGGRAAGVEYTVGSKLRYARAAHEIILCAGAFEPPKLLMLSGIGPEAELKRHGITVKYDSPGVGRNLHDHAEVGVISSMSTNAGYLNEDVGYKMLLNGLQYLLYRSGPVASNGVEACAFLAPDGDRSRPSIQLFCVPSIYLDSDAQFIRPTAGVSLMSCLVKPKSRGSVTLRSAEPTVAPIIDPRYLDHPEDLAAAIQALRISRDILNFAPLSDLIKNELLPGTRLESDNDLADYCRKTVKTGYHPAGTCRMGREEDPMALLDPQLRVKGVSGLRVFDASMMPVLTSSNCNATVMAVADKAVGIMMRETPLQPIEEHPVRIQERV